MQHPGPGGGGGRGGVCGRLQRAKRGHWMQSKLGTVVGDIR